MRVPAYWGLTSLVCSSPSSQSASTLRAASSLRMHSLETLETRAWKRRKSPLVSCTNQSSCHRIKCLRSFRPPICTAKDPERANFDNIRLANDLCLELNCTYTHTHQICANTTSRPLPLRSPSIAHLRRPLPVRIEHWTSSIRSVSHTTIDPELPKRARAALSARASR